MMTLLFDHNIVSNTETGVEITTGSFKLKLSKNVQQNYYHFIHDNFTTYKFQRNNSIICSSVVCSTQ